MGKNLIVSEETIRDLLEAHASLSAWYYELREAVRSAHGILRTPNDAARAAFVERLAIDFPELAPIARTIEVPRMFVPPPPLQGSPYPLDESSHDDVSTLVEPAQARARERASAPELGPPAPSDPDIDPSKSR
jgi:hypothetical protein